MGSERQLPWDLTTESGQYYSNLVGLGAAGRSSWFHQARHDYLASDPFDDENAGYAHFLASFYTAERFLIGQGFGMPPGDLYDLLDAGARALWDAGRGANLTPHRINVRSLMMDLSDAFPAAALPDPVAAYRDDDAEEISPVQRLVVSELGWEYLRRCRTAESQPTAFPPPSVGAPAAALPEPESRHVAAERELAEIRSEVEALRTLVARASEAYANGDLTRAFKLTASATEVLDTALDLQLETAQRHIDFFPDGLAIHVRALRGLLIADRAPPTVDAIVELLTVSVPLLRICDLHLGPVTNSGAFPVSTEHQIHGLVAEHATLLTQLALGVDRRGLDVTELLAIRRNIVGLAKYYEIPLSSEVLEWDRMLQQEGQA